MIDFRYHLVSIIAVFLALALGIVLGTTALNSFVLDNLQGNVKRLTSEKRDQVRQIDDLRGAIGDRTDFIARSEPVLERGMLLGSRVALISVPGVPAALRTALRDALRRAGAVVSTEVRLSPRFTDPREANALDDLATRVVVPGVSLPATSSGAELAAAQLASVLVAKAGTPAPSTDAVQTTLAAYQQGGFLALDAAPSGTAMTSLLVLPAPPSKVTPASQALDAMVLTLGTSLAAEGAGAVVAGTEQSALTGTLAAVRKSSAAKQISTVDPVDQAAGRVAAVLALRTAVAGGAVGSYGFGPGTTAPIPTPSATPAK